MQCESLVQSPPFLKSLSHFDRRPAACWNNISIISIVAMGKASKGKSQQSRRPGVVRDGDGSGATINRSFVKESVASPFVSKLNSIDPSTRLGAVVMLNDLLIQNQSQTVALDKLTCSETLSALSVRLLDANSEVVQQTLLCLTTMGRMGEKYVDKLGTVGIDSTVVRLLTESFLLSTSPMDNNNSPPENPLLSIILEVVKVMYVNSATFVGNQRSTIASLILSHSSKLQSCIVLAEFIYELTLTDTSICQIFHAGELHLYLKGILLSSSADHDNTRQNVQPNHNYHKSILSGTLLCILTSVEDERDNATPLVLSRLVEWVRLNNDYLSRTHDVPNTSSSVSPMLVVSPGPLHRDAAVERTIHLKVISSYCSVALQV